MTLLIAYVAAVVFAVSSAITLVVYLLWRGHLAFWGRRLLAEGSYAEVEQLTMPDGGSVTLRRLALHGEPTTGERMPVLLVHGLAMNHQCLDLGEASLARSLQREGFDVWLVTLRSGRTYLSPFGPRTSTFAAMVEHDLPRAVDIILERTGKPQLDIMGLSMGGMLLYASLGRSLSADKVHRVVLFGSPGQIRPLGLLNLSRFMPAALALSVPLRAMIRTVAFAPRLVPGLVWRRLYNPANMERQFERHMLWNVWEGIPGQLGREFVLWSAANGVVSANRAPVLAGLAQVDVPVLFFAGSVDWLAPVHSVRAAYEAWGSGLPMVEKQFVVLGRETSGATCDYGHCDLVLGQRAHTEAFEPAARFLRADARPRTFVSSPAPKPGSVSTPLALEA
ncbi:MAG: alpha/beta fold hydrolase [Myxococcales bacterium]